MTTGSANDVDSFTYDPNTYRPTNLTYAINPTTSPYTVTTALTWNANWSLQKMIYTDGSPSPLSQTCTYSADDLSRIASTSCGTSTWGQTFTYDPFGNIKKTIPSGYSGTAYAAAYSTVTNQVSSGITPAPTYDKNGNQTTSTPATLTWNALNQPITVNSTSATYDALGRMVEKGLSGTYTQFVFRPSGTILAVYSGSLVKGTIPLPGGSTAIYNASGLSYIRHKDWLGSSRLATMWNHTVYSKVAYAPFGETYNEVGTTPDRSFTGQDQDVVTGSLGTGVYDFLFRKYDPSAGRWLSPDPSGWAAVSQHRPQSLNRYAYVENNPLSSVDPAGLHKDCSGVSIGSECWWFDNSGEVGDEGVDSGLPTYAGSLEDVGIDEGGGLDGADAAVEGAVAESTAPLGDESYDDFNLNPWALMPNGAPLVNQFTGASNYTKRCSVLNPNCKEPSPLQNYFAFLSCENAYLINDLGQGGTAKYGALAAGAVGVQQMHLYVWGTSKAIAKAGLKKGVPVIGEIAALFDSTMLLIKVVQANRTCTNLVYGN